MTTLEKITGEWGTECRCFYCPECGDGYLGDADCPDCDCAVEPAEYCNGFCERTEGAD
mgnify:CR=1 FL=1